MPDTQEMDDLKLDNSEIIYADTNISSSPVEVAFKHEKLSIEHDNRVLIRLGKVPVLKVSASPSVTGAQSH